MMNNDRCERKEKERKKEDDGKKIIKRYTFTHTINVSQSSYYLLL